MTLYWAEEYSSIQQRESCADTCQFHHWATVISSKRQRGSKNVISHLKYFCTHLTCGGPLSTQLHREGLPVLSEHPDPDRVDQHGHHTQPLLFNGVEQDQEPGRKRGGGSNQKKNRMEEWLRR